MPQSEHAHSELLREAARAFLGPLGLTQKGRSQTWLDDNEWWLCVVEFQPSGFSKGSYLNVVCMWLWQEKDYLSFDEGYRVERFVSFEDAIQFKVAATKLAGRAAAEVNRYRSMFPTMLHVSDYYLKSNPSLLWPSFNAAVACGVVGRITDARRFFANVLELIGDREWVKSAQTEANHLNTLLNDTNSFRHTVAEKVSRTRRMLKLPEKEIASF